MIDAREEREERAGTTPLRLEAVGLGWIGDRFVQVPAPGTGGGVVVTDGAHGCGTVATIGPSAQAPSARSQIATDSERKVAFARTPVGSARRAYRLAGTSILCRFRPQKATT